MQNSHDDAPGSGAPIAIAAETPPDISELIFDLDDPITRALAATAALEHLLDEPMRPNFQAAIIELSFAISSNLNILRGLCDALFEVRRALTQKAQPTKASTAAPMPPDAARFLGVIEDAELNVSAVGTELDGAAVLLDTVINYVSSQDAGDKTGDCLIGIRAILEMLHNKIADIENTLFKASSKAANA